MMYLHNDCSVNEKQSKNFRLDKTETLIHLKLILSMKFSKDMKMC